METQPVDKQYGGLPQPAEAGLELEDIRVTARAQRGQDARQHRGEVFRRWPVVHERRP